MPGHGGVARAAATCNLRCTQCRARRANGQRCRNRICKYLPFCNVHARSIFGVTVRPSGIHGAGLFATRAFAPGQPVAPLLGRYLTKRRLDAIYGDNLNTAPYAVTAPPRLLRGRGRLARNRRTVVDGACARYIGHYANTATAPHGERSDARRCNANFENRRLSVHMARQHQSIPWIVATRAIPAGGEIVAAYGPTYGIDRQHRDYFHMTRRTRR